MLHPMIIERQRWQTVSAGILRWVNNAIVRNAIEHSSHEDALLRLDIASRSQACGDD